MKKILWRLSMKWIVYAYTHFLPSRNHTGTPLERFGEGFAVCPEDDRWTLHTLAAAPPDHPYADYTFWIRPVELRDFQYWHPEEVRTDWFKVYEVESGGYAFGQTPQEAISNYWRHD